MRSGVLLTALLLILSQPMMALARVATLATPYVFTDGKAIIRIPTTQPEVRYRLKTITRDGWGPTAESVAKVTGGQIEIAPRVEGIHIITLLPGHDELRFLAMAPPAPLSKKAVVHALPRNGLKLLANQPYTIVLMGDSVTSTGDYKTMLKMLLARATGNQQITLVDRSKFGMTADYSVRRWAMDGPPHHPDLGLIMYGLNDQRNYEPDAYVEQYHYLSQRFIEDCHADVIFLQPTPHFDWPVNPGGRTTNANPPWFELRTAGYDEWLNHLGAQDGIPVAKTFAAVWGGGGRSLEAAARNAWPICPRDFKSQFTSMLESAGAGDPVHINALGQLMIARAVYDTIAGVRAPQDPLTLTGRSLWTPTGVISRILLRNTSSRRRAGRVVIYPPLEAQLKMLGPGSYDLGPGEAQTFEVSWPQATKPVDLLHFPDNVYLAPGHPCIPVVDYCGPTSHVYAVVAPFAGAQIVRGRITVDGPELQIPCRSADGVTRKMIKVTLPAGSSVGRIPLEEEFKEKFSAPQWAVAELAYVRFGQAVRGEATVDGNLTEWSGQKHWMPVGEPCQARWVFGVEDHRATPQECYLRWAVRAGSTGVYLAARGTGQLHRDHFILYFDPRKPELLGTVGSYYWVNGRLEEGGQLALSTGETSPSHVKLAGVWKDTPNGTNLELFIPYRAFDQKVWPAGGDLGFSVWWVHTGASGKVTNLLWSDDGFPWTPRWYGVVRLDEGAARPLPYMVRVK